MLPIDTKQNSIAKKHSVEISEHKVQLALRFFKNPFSAREAFHVPEPNQINAIVLPVS